MTKPALPPSARLPVACARCGWHGWRLPGKPVQCPRCGALAAFQTEGEG
jgi:predicted Zn-ribbon and HTH transcriptional regulator